MDSPVAIDPNCSSTPWWLPIVTGGLGLAIAAVKWIQNLSLHPKLRDFNQRLAALETHEAEERRAEEMRKIALEVLARRGKVQ